MRSDNDDEVPETDQPRWRVSALVFLTCLFLVVQILVLWLL